MAVLGALGLNAAPGVHAGGLEIVEADTDDFNGVELLAYQMYPDVPVPQGASFIWTVTAYSGVSQMDSVAMTAPVFSSGCEVVSSTWNNFTATFSEFSYTIRIVDDSCAFEVGSSASDAGVLGDVAAHLHLTGTVVSYTVHEIGQDPVRGALVYWWPVVLFFGVAAYAIRSNLPGTAVMATAAALSTQLNVELVTLPFALLVLLATRWVEGLAKGELRFSHGEEGENKGKVN